MRYFLRILAVLMIGIGVVWILQGVNILPGSFMTGQMQWAYRGIALAIGGVLLLVFFGRKLPRR
jgi:hypothetical protein